MTTSKKTKKPKLTYRSYRGACKEAGVLYSPEMYEDAKDMEAFVNDLVPRQTPNKEYGLEVLLRLVAFKTACSEPRAETLKALMVHKGFTATEVGGKTLFNISSASKPLK